MAFSDPYLRNRANNTDVSVKGNVAAGDAGPVVLATGKTGWTIFVQRVHIHILTSAAQTAAFQDNNGTPVKVGTTDSAPGADAEYHWDAGPDGRGLTEAKNLVISLSGAGLAFWYNVEAYMKQTGNEYVSATATGQSFA